MTARLAAAWFGLIATPILALTALEAKFALTSWACRSGGSPVLFGITALSLLVSISGGILCWHAWKQMGCRTDLGGAGKEQWASSLSIMGLSMTVLMSYFLFALGIVHLWVDSCD